MDVFRPAASKAVSVAAVAISSTGLILIPSHTTTLERMKSYKLLTGRRRNEAGYG
jgi:hypothetical protein